MENTGSRESGSYSALSGNCRIDGTIDFGAGYEEERWGRTNIREKAIEVR